MQLDFPTERSSLLDSLDWSRKFDIFSISRLSLNASGIPVELVKSLSDEDMHAIAEQTADLIVQEPIEKIAEFVARPYLSEKGTSHGNKESMQVAELQRDTWCAIVSNSKGRATYVVSSIPALLYKTI